MQKALFCITSEIEYTSMVQAIFMQTNNSPLQYTIPYWRLYCFEFRNLFCVLFIHIHDCTMFMRTTSTSIQKSVQMCLHIKRDRKLCLFQKNMRPWTYKKCITMFIAHNSKWTVYCVWNGCFNYIRYEVLCYTLWELSAASYLIYHFLNKLCMPYYLGQRFGGFNC